MMLRPKIDVGIKDLSQSETESFLNDNIITFEEIYQNIVSNSTHRPCESMLVITSIKYDGLQTCLEDWYQIFCTH